MGGKKIFVVKKVKIVTYSDYVTTANVELDQQTAFESAMRIFKREVNNSNIINEVKRRRYYEEAWMTRRHKEKERAMKAKTFRRVETYDDKNPLTDNSVFASDFGVIDTLLKPQRILHTDQKKNSHENNSFTNSTGESNDNDRSKETVDSSMSKTLSINDSTTLDRILGYDGSNLKKIEMRTNVRMTLRALNENNYCIIIYGASESVLEAEELLQKAIKEKTN